MVLIAGGLIFHDDLMFYRSTHMTSKIVGENSEDTKVYEVITT